MNNQTKINSLLIGYIVATLLHITGVLIEERSLMLVFKPLLMPILMLIYMLSTSKINYWFLTALFFSFLGDVFLLFQGELFFMLGLASFLLAHVIYIKIIISKLDKIRFKEIITTAIPFLIFIAIFFYALGSRLGEMFAPVIVYAITISVFGIFALYHYQKKSTSKALVLLLGACIFIVSDTNIAVDRFYQSSKYYTIIIMLTYVLAQYLICKSIIEEKIT